MAVSRGDTPVPGTSGTGPARVDGAAADVPGAGGRRSAATAWAPAVDGLAILVFVTIGQLSHHGHVSAAGYAEDALPLLAAWFAADRAFRRRFVPTWLVGVSAGVLLRAAILGHWYAKELAFWLVAVVTIGLFAGAGRLTLRLLAGRRSLRAPQAGL